MLRKIIVAPMSHSSIEDNDVEMCEHKGIGHPDTITDGVCEAASRALSLENIDRVTDLILEEKVAIY